MSKKKIIILFLILTVELFSNAQRPTPPEIAGILEESSLTGKVMDKDLNVPMEYTNVVLYRVKDSSMVTGIITNAEGKFELKNLPFGRFYLVLDFIGYNKDTVPDILLTPKQNSMDLDTIYLKSASVHIQGVEIVGERKHIEYKLDKKIVNVSQDINASSGTAVDVLQNTPSVNVDIEGNVSLRGSGSFTVLIDGRPSPLQGSDALQQIPASTIENIEIITNPSAKYDPDGVAGIINVIMKKQKNMGVNGIFNTTLGTGNKYKGDFLLNYKTSKMNIFGGMDYNNMEFSRNGLSRQEYFDDTTTIIAKDDDGYFKRKGHEFKLGIDFYIKEKDILSLSGNIGSHEFKMDSRGLLHEYTQPQTADKYSINKSNTSRGEGYYEFTLNYQHKFDKEGHEISGMAYYSKEDGSDDDLQEAYTTNQDGIISNPTPDSKRGYEDAFSNDIRIKVDYMKPLNSKNGKLEAGYQSRLQPEDQDYRMEEYDSLSGTWTLNNLYSKSIKFKRNIHSVYSTFSSKIGSIEYQLGLRGEYTDREISSKTSAEKYTFSRLDYFPTIHVSHSFGKNNQIHLSYTRRIERPRGWNLEPFVSYIDPYNLRQGNPALKPEYINSYEFGCQKRFETSFFSVEGYYRITNNKIARIIISQENNISLSTVENLNKDYSLGTELMANVDVIRWFSFNASGNIYRYWLEGSINGESVDSKSNNWDARLNSTFKITPVTRVQVNTMYNGPSVTAQGKRGDFFFTNMAIKQEFMKRKLSATLHVQDIFKTMQHEITSYGENFYSYDKFSREAPVVMLSLSLKMNNYKDGKRKDTEEMDAEFDQEF